MSQERSPRHIVLGECHVIANGPVNSCTGGEDDAGTLTDATPPVFDGATPTAESQPLCCSVCPDSHVSLVSHTYRGGQFNGLARTTYLLWYVVIRHCSATPPCVSTTASPCASCSPRLVVVTATRGVWSNYRQIRLKRVRFDLFTFPTVRLHSLQANATSGLSDASMPVLLTRCDELSAHQDPVLVVQWCVRPGAAWGSSVDASLEGQALPLPALHVVGLPPSSVNPTSLHITQRFNVVASLS